MQTCTSHDGTTIAYQRSGAGPVVILVDGAFGYRAGSPLTPLGAVLEPRFTVIRYDRRGRGDSGDTSPYAVDREIDDLAALIEAAGGSAYVHGLSSGAVLGLLAADRGLPVRKLSLFEPPLPGEGMPARPELAGELATLVAEGRRGDAVEHFQLAIGLPEQMVTGMRHAPFRPALEALAHTLVYDTTITGSFPVDVLSRVTTPTLVLDSDGSGEPLRAAAKLASQTLPNADYRTLPGQFHDVPAEALAAALTAFFAEGP